VIAFDESAPGCRFVVTDRHGGVSTAPFDGLNLGGHVGDDADAVRRNRGLVAEALDVEPDHLIFMSQVHGDEVRHVDGPWTGQPPSCDALVTTRPDLALAVLVADCVPVLLAAPEEGVLGVAHAGRAGMAAGVAVRLVDAMRDLGARTILGRLGPSVCARCYPVGEQLREQVAGLWPVTRSVSWHGEPSLDVSAGVLEQLRPRCSDVEQLPGCTVERDDLFSYRRDGRTGRFAGVVRLVDQGRA
jgi:YfiH family protein